MGKLFLVIALCLFMLLAVQADVGDDGTIVAACYSIYSLSADGYTKQQIYGTPSPIRVSMDVFNYTTSSQCGEINFYAEDAIKIPQDNFNNGIITMNLPFSSYSVVVSFMNTQNTFCFLYEEFDTYNAASIRYGDDCLHPR